MKLKTLFIVCSLLILGSSCDKSSPESPESSDGIVGEWLLIEVLADPGDGSGTFQPITSNKEVKFNSDGTFEANGNMCQMTNQADSVQFGTYDTIVSSFSPNYCAIMAPLTYSYSVDGDKLILTYPCICGCQQKYIRL